MNNPVVLIVDDQELNRTLFESMLREDGYRTRTAASGQAALEAVEAELPDLILLDLVMPGIGGLDVLQRLKAQERSRVIPIVVITGFANPDSRTEAFQAGAEDFLAKPVERSELRARVRNLLRMKEYHDIVVQHSRTLESEVQERTAQLRNQYRETVYLMTSAAEYRDEDTGAHVRRISALSAELARRCGMDDHYVDCILYASPMHDIGKIGSGSDPAQAEPARYRGVGDHEEPHAPRLEHIEKGNNAVRENGRRDLADPPRAVGRERISARSCGGGDTPVRPHPDDVRPVRRAAKQSTLQAGVRPRPGHGNPDPRGRADTARAFLARTFSKSFGVPRMFSGSSTKASPPMKRGAAATSCPTVDSPSGSAARSCLPVPGGRHSAGLKIWDSVFMGRGSPMKYPWEWFTPIESTTFCTASLCTNSAMV